MEKDRRMPIFKCNGTKKKSQIQLVQLDLNNRKNIKQFYFCNYVMNSISLCVNLLIILSKNHIFFKIM